MHVIAKENGNDNPPLSICPPATNTTRNGSQRVPHDNTEVVVPPVCGQLIKQLSGLEKRITLI